MRKLLYEAYNALTALINVLNPPEPEPEPEVAPTRTMKSKGGK